LKVSDCLLEPAREVEVYVHAVAGLIGNPGEKTRGPLEYPVLRCVEEHPGWQPALCEPAPELCRAIRQGGSRKSDAIV